MSGLDLYDRDGQAITLAQWSFLMESGEDYRRVASTDVGLYTVSTVWLGINHAFLGGPPMIFETMVFACDDGEVSDFHSFDVDRYATEAAALAGHEETVTMVAATTGLFS